MALFCYAKFIMCKRKMGVGRITAAMKHLSSVINANELTGMPVNMGRFK